MTINPAPVNTGIRFRRTDLGPDAYVDALAENVSNTARSTTITGKVAAVATIEHVLSALTGMGVDNALIDIDNIEVPILAGIASLFVFYSFWAIFLFFEGGFGKVAPHDGELHLENAN